MSVKRKPQPREKAARKAPAKKVEAVQECPAYHICREKGVDCSVCLELPVGAWREHVKAVLLRGANSAALPHPLHARA